MLSNKEAETLREIAAECLAQKKLLTVLVATLPDDQRNTCLQGLIGNTKSDSTDILDEKVMQLAQQIHVFSEVIRSNPQEQQAD